MLEGSDESGNANARAGSISKAGRASLNLQRQVKLACFIKPQHSLVGGGGYFPVTAGRHKFSLVRAMLHTVGSLVVPSTNAMSNITARQCTRSLSPAMAISPASRTIPESNAKLTALALESITYRNLLKHMVL
ncbi:hypothetical protein SCA6_018762 [Theobroma cacao]